MALAYLCSQIRRHTHDIEITDNPCSGFRGFIIDHKLREGSTEEARNVATALQRLGVPGEVHQVNWRKDLGFAPEVNISEVTNIESAARRARYRRLGRLCSFRRMATLLLAHHQDDQYETVLMRLMTGHRGRALRGMRTAASIPECEGEFGAFDSGWVDDQKRREPFYNTGLTKRQKKYLKEDLRLSIDHLMGEDESIHHPLTGLEEYDSSEGIDWAAKGLMNFSASGLLGTMPIEDGGVSIYRPLLEFSKDRLIATCLENNVPWFEDATNKDLRLTTRNSIRHIYKSCELPQALQKPAILALSKNWQRRAEIQDAEANRLLQRIVLHDFEPHVGTLVVQLPDLPVLQSRRYSRTPERFKRHILRKRATAALALRRVIALVSPELQAPTVANLQNVITRLFPALAESHDALAALPPKGFNIAGLHFMPVESKPNSATAPERSYPRTWYISRQPHPTTTPLPQWRVPYWSPEKQTNKRKVRLNRRKWSSWLPWQYWDNRFWIRLTHRFPYRVVVLPLLAEHMKHFRESLGPRDRDRLATILKKYAPGKVRYTLPAIYTEEYLDLDNVVARPGYPLTEEEFASGKIPTREEKGPVHPLDISKMRLVALPSLGIQLSGLEKWLLHEIRYKRADRATLKTMGSYDRSSFSSLENEKPYTAVGRSSVKAKFKRPFATRSASSGVS